MTNAARNRHAAFTLIELLVVVAVVGVLLAVLLPALASARGSAMMITGASNIRQLQIANLAYAGDNDTRFMPGAVEMQRTNLHRWHGVRSSINEPFDADRGPIAHYLGDEASSADGGVRQCPVFAPTLDELRRSDDGFEAGNGGYGYNNAFVGTVRTRRVVGDTTVWETATTKQGSRQTDFRKPDRTVAFADTAFAAFDLIEYSFVEPVLWPQFATPFQPDPSIHFRHVGDRANIAWLDGRVTQERFAFTNASGIYPTDPAAFGLGWFGHLDDANTFFDYD